MQFLAKIPDAIFFWLKMFVPVLFILRLIKVQLRLINMQSLITALSITLLFGGVMYLLYFPVGFFIAYYSATDYEQYALINKATGPYWFSFWIPVVISMLLPQIMWFQKARNDIAGIYIWFCFSLLLAILQFYTFYIITLKRDYIPSKSMSIWVNFDLFPSSSKSIQTLIIFLAVLLPIYFIVLKTQKNRLSASPIKQ